jgi:hypothetical protein
VSTLPEPVRQVTAHYLALAEEHVPGLLEGVYLLGSLGWGEWYDGRSDVDFLAVTCERPAPGPLRDLHAELERAFPRPFFSGSYVTWSDLARSPGQIGEVPGILEEHPEDASRPDLVEWFVLGIPRLHHAIATGQTSKDGAGHYALEVFGKQRWRPVVAEALAHRALGGASGTWAGRQHQLADEVLAFCRLTLDAGLALDPTDDTDETDPAERSATP